MVQSVSSKRLRLPPAWIICVLGTGIALSIALYFTIRSWEERESEKEVVGIARKQVEKLEISMLRSMEVLHSVASLFAAEGAIDEVKFHRFVERALRRQPELLALSWNPVVPEAKRAELEAAMAAGHPGFELREFDATGRLIRAAQRAEYIPVHFIEPVERNRQALGYDLNSHPLRRASLELARDSGQPVATAPIRLAQEWENQTGFLVLLPVYQAAATNVTERRQQLAGFADAAFRVSDLVGDAFSELHARGIAAWLLDESPKGELLHHNVSAGALPKPDDTDGRLWLKVAGRRWTLVFRPTEVFLTAQSQYQSWLTLAAGLAFTLLATAYLYGGWHRAREAAAANAALEEEVRVRQRAEAAAATANAAKSDFLASMSHEIRTPLNAMLGYTQLMQRDPHLRAEQRDAIAGISASGHHLLGLINEILDLSKIEAGRMELNPVDFDLALLGRSLSATFQPLCAQKRIGFRIELTAASPIRVRGDEGKLRQVLINLMGNAVKFTCAGEVYLRLSKSSGDAWVFEVIDTGLGIPVEEQSDIFKPFHQGKGTRHQGGTGLGLAIARRQVELLGGSLELQSERGIGSRFHFTIPLERAAGEVESEREVTRLAAGSRVCALVVDDRRENGEVIGGMLALVGCDVWQAENGEEAIRLARLHQPDIVFLDLLLPDSSGAEIARRLLSDPACGTPKVIAHTASALSKHRDEALAAGCIDFLPKPLRCERLYDCLKGHLAIDFEYAAPVAEPEATDWAVTKVQLPDGLCARLTVAAELHSTTALKAGLQELRDHGPDAQKLADHIRLLMRSYDMDAILRVLVQVTTPHASTTEHGFITR